MRGVLHADLQRLGLHVASQVRRRLHADRRNTFTVGLNVLALTTIRADLKLHRGADDGCTARGGDLHAPRDLPGGRHDALIDRGLHQEPLDRPSSDLKRSDARSHPRCCRRAEGHGVDPIDRGVGQLDVERRRAALRHLNAPLDHRPTARVVDAHGDGAPRHGRSIVGAMQSAPEVHRLSGLVAIAIEQEIECEGRAQPDGYSNVRRFPAPDTSICSCA